jgi:ABC-type branched-subunit amino acid transport system permease subunit
VFGIDFEPQQNFVLLLAVVFALLGVSMVALRRSAYGRRLTAMKNSPAACATLGLSIVRLKLSVFMLSAAQPRVAAMEAPAREIT